MKRINIVLRMLLVVTGIFLSKFSSAQVKTFHFEQLDSLQAIKEKPVIVFLHTSWCRYCEGMKNTTFKNAAIIQMLNEHFYFVSFDCEGKKDIFFHGHTFTYRPTGANMNCVKKQK